MGVRNKEIEPQGSHSHSLFTELVCVITIQDFAVLISTCAHALQRIHVLMVIF
jgi:hypothetical protein